MAQGLQIFDENGINTLDTNSGTIKILGKYDYDPDIKTLTHPLLATEEPFYMITPQYRYNDVDLQVSFSGNTCTIRNTKKFFPKTIYIGVR